MTVPARPDRTTRCLWCGNSPAPRRAWGDPLCEDCYVADGYETDPWDLLRRRADGGD